MSLNCRKFVFYSLVSATLFSLCSISSGWAAAPELKPVLKPIDPSMAKLDAPPPDPESESNSVPDPAEDPGAKFNRTQQSSSSIPQAPSAPALGSYGMPGGGDPAPYRPSTDPNDRRNQVFTPPWQQKQYSPAPVKQAPPQTRQNIPVQGAYQNRYPQQPQYQQQYQQPYQQQYRQPQYQQPQYQQPQYQQRPQYQQQYQPYQQNQAYQRQYSPYQNRGYNNQSGYGRNQYQNPYPNQPQYQNSYGGGYQQQQPRVNSYQNQNQYRTTGAGGRNGFPSVDMIPDFDKPLPSNTSSGGAGSRWTTNSQTRGNSRMVNSPRANSPLTRVEKLERTAFGSTYPEHDVEARLDHLEKEIFGSKSSGSVNERLSRLEYKLGGKGAFNQGYGDKNNAKKEQLADTAGSAINAPEKTELSRAIPLSSVPYDKRAGDYFDRIKRFPGNTVARFTEFPVKVRIPEKTPEVWSDSLKAAMEEWSKLIPVVAAQRTESADVEVSWVNHLSPRLLGVTRLTAFNGRPKVKIFLLRPTYYVQNIPEKALDDVFLHELGHGLGLFGHSGHTGDLMYVTELVGGKLSSRSAHKITPRDINTLRRVYESKPLPAGYSTPKPVEWS